MSMPLSSSCSLPSSGCLSTFASYLKSAAQYINYKKINDVDLEANEPQQNIMHDGRELSLSTRIFNTCPGSRTAIKTAYVAGALITFALATEIGVLTALWATSGSGNTNETNVNKNRTFMNPNAPATWSNHTDEASGSHRRQLTIEAINHERNEAEYGDISEDDLEAAGIIIKNYNGSVNLIPRDYQEAEDGLAIGDHGWQSRL